MKQPHRSPFASLQRIGMTEARWTQGFWAERFEICRNVMVPTMGALMGKEQRVRFLGNFEVAAGLVDGAHRGPKWNDGDFYKWLESAAAIAAVNPDPQPAAELNRIIDLIARAQDADGYIHTDVQIKRRAGQDVARFGNPMDFEMYNMGHLMTAAGVHHQATGEHNLLKIATAAADFLATVFEQPTPSQARHGICPAHLMGLVDLYRVTGRRRYLDLAVKLLDMRDLVQSGDDDNQDRVPFRQQRQATGHAVRATYLYAGAADIYAETGDESLLPTLRAVWDDLASRKLYITGGCGALFDGASPDGSADQLTITRVHQAFGRDYQLPHSTAHNETCAAIGSVLWNWRMLQITGEARFAELVEQTLYNSVLAGISLDGTSFFYTNTLRQLDPMPAELRWNRHRQRSISCFCCPPNVVRTIAQSAGYAYAKGERELRLILYGGSTLDTEIAGAGRVKLRQETEYPWDGRVRITIEAAPREPFTLNLHIPSWATGATVDVAGRRVDHVPQPDTFHPIDQRWSAGDVVELNLPMPVRLVEANPYVEEARDQVSVMRGPVVYCLESADLLPDVKVLDVRLPSDATFTPRTSPDLPGIRALAGKGIAISNGDWSGRLYREFTPQPRRAIDLQLVPYFAWDNRRQGEMTVWLPLA